MSNQQVKNYIGPVGQEEVVEDLKAGLTTVPATTTVALKVAEGTISGGYDGVIVSIAVSQNNSILAWIMKQAKQIYDNGLNSAALPANLGECPLYKSILEKEKWELGLTNTSGGAIVVAWLIRIREFRKGA